jgi:formate dehydrogenase subunit gamma
MRKTFERFTKRQRIEHFTIMTLFLLLAVTGFPQKFYESGVSRFVVDLIGGLPRLRFVHRVSGILFSIFTVVHISTATLLVLTRKARLTMVPRRQDFRDAMMTLRYYIGIGDQQAHFGRFDYRQKFEYWGLLLGGAVMVTTGLILYFPTAFASLLPGQLIPASKVAHSNEGLMALLIVITWHIYNAHFNPDVFPFDKTIFTGKISRERMEHEHPLELEELEAHEEAPAPREV